MNTSVPRCPRCNAVIPADAPLGFCPTCELSGAALASEWAAAGRAHDFEVLKPWLIGDTDSLSQADAARQLGMREGAVKVAIHRLRKRLRQILREAIAQTVTSPTEVDEELRYFVRVLCDSGRS